MSDARDAKRLWESFEPIRTPEEAQKLSAAGTYACLILLADQIYPLIVGIDGAATAFGGCVLPTVMLIWNSKRQNMWPAYGILILSALQMLAWTIFVTRQIDNAPRVVRVVHQRGVVIVDFPEQPPASHDHTAEVVFPMRVIGLVEVVYCRDIREGYPNPRAPKGRDAPTEVDSTAAMVSAQLVIERADACPSIDVHGIVLDLGEWAQLSPMG